VKEEKFGGVNGGKRGETEVGYTIDT